VDRLLEVRRLRAELRQQLPLNQLKIPASYDLSCPNTDECRKRTELFSC